MFQYPDTVLLRSPASLLPTATDTTMDTPEHHLTEASSPSSDAPGLTPSDTPDGSASRPIDLTSLSSSPETASAHYTPQESQSGNPNVTDNFRQLRIDGPPQVSGMGHPPEPGVMHPQQSPIRTIHQPTPISATTAAVILQYCRE
jgi:hypothetical protein